MGLFKKKQRSIADLKRQVEEAESRKRVAVTRGNLRERIMNAKEAEKKAKGKGKSQRGKKILSKGLDIASGFEIGGGFGGDLSGGTSPKKKGRKRCKQKDFGFGINFG